MYHFFVFHNDGIRKLQFINMRATFFKYYLLFPNLVTLLKNSKQSNPLSYQGQAMHSAVAFIPCILGYGNCGTIIMLFISSFSLAVANTESSSTLRPML